MTTRKINLWPLIILEPFEGISRNTFKKENLEIESSWENHPRMHNFKEFFRQFGITRPNTYLDLMILSSQEDFDENEIIGEQQN